MAHCVNPTTMQPGACQTPLTVAQLLSYAYQAGFRGTSLITAVAVALVESSGIPNAVNDSSGAYGLWQINPAVHDAQHPAMSASTLDPLANAKLARALAPATGGPNGQSDFSAWTNGYGSAQQTQLSTNLSLVETVAATLKPPYSTAASTTKASQGGLNDEVSPNPGLPNPLSFNWGPIAWILVGLVAAVAGLYLMTHGQEKEVVVEREPESGGEGEAA